MDVIHIHVLFASTCTYNLQILNIKKYQYFFLKIVPGLQHRVSVTDIRPTTFAFISTYCTEMCKAKVSKQANQKCFDSYLFFINIGTTPSIYGCEIYIIFTLYLIDERLPKADPHLYGLSTLGSWFILAILLAESIIFKEWCKFTENTCFISHRQ